MSASADIAGVVLAAGLGTRLRPLTDIRPKPLCPVGNVPLVDAAIAHVCTVTHDVAVNVHHHRQRMQEHLAPLGVHVSVEEPEPLGTAGAIGQLRSWIDGRPTLIHNSDAWHAATDLADLLVDGWDGERIRLLVVAPAARAWRPTSPMAPSSPAPASTRGATSPSSSRNRPDCGRSVWRGADAAGRIELIPFDGPWFDTGTPSTYLAANLAASDGDSVIAPDADVQAAGDDIVRSVVWPGAIVAAGERLHEQVRAADAGGRPVTVDGATTEDVDVNVLALRIADRARRLVWKAFGPRIVGVRGIVVDATTEPKKVLLVHHSYGKPAWHLPGGGVKRRETIEQAVRREVHEEANVEVTGPVRLLGTYSNLREGKSDHISVFVIEHWRRLRTDDRDDDAEIAAKGFFDVTPEGLPETTSPGTRRRLAEWEKGHVNAYEW